MIDGGDGDDSVSPACATSMAAVFVESATAFHRINVLIDNNQLTADMDAALADLRGIFDKYLEMPSLLDKDVEAIVTKLATAARELMNDRDLTTSEQFWSSPLPRQLSAIYAISKVRGRKRVQKFLPHGVEHVDTILRVLRDLHTLSRIQGESTDRMESSDLASPKLWESIYVLWNWMAILSLVPFRLTVVIDKNHIDELVELAKQYFSEAGPTREMAAACLAWWLSRPDLETTHLTSFQLWADLVLQEYLNKPSDIMKTMGVLQTLTAILKVSTSDRSNLLRFVTPLWPTMAKITESKPNNLLLRKYLIKWWTRIGTLYMPPRVVSWRYQRGCRSLKENLMRSTKVAKGPKSAIEKPTKISHPTPEQYELFLVPDQVEDAIGEVISGLSDPSTNVRWSAAKGVGRITERLPAICSDDVLDAILKLFEDREKDNDWHGACLALAELARRGLLLPHRLSEVIPKVVDAIHFDVPRRQTSVGAHVRDAACYTYWAFARAYSPEVLRPFASSLTQSVVAAFLFDREVNCRRAASAAFQEFLGRQGATNFKHGISILTKADFFSLGNRTETYLSIATDIAQFDEYRNSIIDHLYKVKLRHWDRDIRDLASQALGRLTILDVDYISIHVVPYLLHNSLDERDVQLRHGSVLGLAEIILGVGQMKGMRGEAFTGLLSAETLSQTAELVPMIEKKRLYRGKGGEQMRAAVCRLIECISLAGIPLSVPLQVRLLDSVDACIPHPNEDVQVRATVALSHLMRVYFPVGPSGPSDRLQKRVVDKYVNEVKTSINPAVTRGFSMALGCLPAKLLAPSSRVLDQSLACLCRVARPDATIGDEKDAETRRNALVALARICNTVGMAPHSTSNCESHVFLSSTQIRHVFTSHFRSLEDYNMDRRGDVGSMSRIVAMKGLVSLAIAATNAPPDCSEPILGEEICTKLVGGLLKQLAEKLDAVRSEAGDCLWKLLTYTEPLIPFIPEKDQLMEIFVGDTATGISVDQNINWANPAVTFPLVTRCLDLVPYFPFVVSGLIISVGCLSQSVTKEAAAALVAWVKKASTKNIDRLGKVLLEIFEQHQHEGRVILPLLKAIRLLMDRLCIDVLVRDDCFSLSLLRLLGEEESRCKDVHRLTALIDVSLGLLSPDNDGARQKDVLRFVCKLLRHPFPRVRRLAAENFYVKLLEQPWIQDDHPAISLLLGNAWDGDVSDTEIQRMAADVAEALDIHEERPNDNEN